MHKSCQDARKSVTTDVSICGHVGCNALVMVPSWSTRSGHPLGPSFVCASLPHVVGITRDMWGLWGIVWGPCGHPPGAANHFVARYGRVCDMLIVLERITFQIRGWGTTVFNMGVSVAPMCTLFNLLGPPSTIVLTISHTNNRIQYNVFGQFTHCPKRRGCPSHLLCVLRAWSATSSVSGIVSVST